MIISGNVRYHDDLGALLVDASLLRPHPDNPSSGDEQAIVESIEINGMYRPVYVQQTTGHVLAGNTTYSACLALGASLIPVIWLDVDDETALRILLGDNQLARLAIVDQGLLSPLLQQLLDSERQLLGTGYPGLPDLPEPQPIEPTYTITVVLDADQMAAWFELPADTDADRLDYLMGLR